MLEMTQPSCFEKETNIRAKRFALRETAKYNAAVRLLSSNGLPLYNYQEGEKLMKNGKKLMKKTLAILLGLIMALSIAACGGGDSNESSSPPASSPPASSPSASSSPTGSDPASGQESPSQQPQDTPLDPVEIIVFAAASMTDTLLEIQELYRDVAPHVTLVFNFDSSGTLKTQIEEGAPVDVFISAAQRQMNELGELGFIQDGTRIDILENKVALVVAPGNPKGITSFDGLVTALQGGDILMAMGNSDVPVGQYTIEILKYFDLDEDALARSGVITYGSNVREVTTQVTEASVDVGIVYATDAFSTGLQVVDTATAAMCGGQVIYPAAVMNVSEDVEAAQAFLDYLLTPPAMAVFEGVGFSPV